VKLKSGDAQWNVQQNNTNITYITNWRDQNQNIHTIYSLYSKKGMRNVTK